jgi:hypothetical protein
MSSLSPDIIPVLARRPDLEVTDRSGTNFTYLGPNLEDPALSLREVRQALASPPIATRSSAIFFMFRPKSPRESCRRTIGPPNPTSRNTRTTRLALKSFSIPPVSPAEKMGSAAASR